MSIRTACAAMTAGTIVAAAAVGGVPDRVAGAFPPSFGAPGVALTATSIPIIDFDQTFGPLSLLRRLTATFDTPSATSLQAALDALSKTGWSGPLGATGLWQWAANLPVLADWVPGTRTSAQLTPSITVAVVAQPFGPTGPSVNAGFGATSQAKPIVYLGGPDGLGAGLSARVNPNAYGLFSWAGVGSANASFVADSRILPSQLVVVPGGGLKATLGASLGGAVAGGIAAGSVFIYGTLNGSLSNAVSLCTGSAVAGCGGVIARDTVSARVYDAMTISGPVVGTVPVVLDLPNQLDVTLKPDSLSVTGQVGGTLTVGSTTIGRIVPVDVHIPLGSTPFSVAAARANTAAATLPTAGADAAAQDHPRSKSAPAKQHPHAGGTRTAGHDPAGTGRSARTAQRSSAD